MYLGHEILWTQTLLSGKILWWEIFRPCNKSDPWFGLKCLVIPDPILLSPEPFPLSPDPSHILGFKPWAHIPCYDPEVFSIVYIVEEDSHSTDLSVSGEEGDSTILLAHYSTGNKSQKVFFKTYQSKSTAVWLRKKSGGKYFLPPISPKITPLKGKEKSGKSDRGERKEENKKSFAYTLSFYVEFFEDSTWTRKQTLFNQSINLYSS